MYRSHGQVTTLALGLVSITVIMLVFMTGRFWGLPLDYDRQEHLRLIELTFPPFFAILAMAVYSATSSKTRSNRKLSALYATLILVPPVLFLGMFLFLTYVFTYSNSAAGVGEIFSLDEYRTWVMILLSFIACTTSALCLDLFK